MKLRLSHRRARRYIKRRVTEVNRSFNMRLNSSGETNTMILEQSRQLLRLADEHQFSHEIFIRANGLLRKYLFHTGVKHADQSILLACLSLTIKLNEHSSYLSIHPTVVLHEELLCHALDWDLDSISPINYVEALLPFFADATLRCHLRRLTYRLLTFCLTDTRCANLSLASLSIGCLRMACGLTGITDRLPKPLVDDATLFDIQHVLAR